MRAVIIATTNDPGMAALSERHPPPLFPLVDRPFVQHLVEFLGCRGVRKIDFIVRHLPGKVDSFLDNGRRWGAEFRYHAVPQHASPSAVLQTLIKSGGAGPFLLGRADSLAMISLEDPLPGRDSLPVLFSRRDPGTDRAHGPGCWTGWALLSAEQLSGLPTLGDETHLEMHLASGAAGVPTWHEVTASIGVRSLSQIFEAHQLVLGKEFSGLFLSGREVAPGVWLGRRCRVHSTASLSRPVFIGENCIVGARARLGPHAVLVRDCVLDDRCTVANSIILPGSYVGRGLGLAGVIVDQKYMIDGKRGEKVRVDDNSLLGSLPHGNFLEGFARLFARGKAGRRQTAGEGSGSPRE